MERRRAITGANLRRRKDSMLDPIHEPNATAPKGVCWAQAKTLERCTYPTNHSYPHEWEQKQPDSWRAFMARFNANQAITGTGIHNMRIRTPCPFCAAPDFLAFKITDVRAAMQQPTTCKECQRSCKAVFNIYGRTVDFELVQTAGPEQASWAKSRMRRVQPDEMGGFTSSRRRTP